MRRIRRRRLHTARFWSRPPTVSFASTAWESTNLPQQRRTADLQTDDIALTGLSGWPGIDLAASNGDCSFNATTHTDGNFANWASTPNVARLAGDFNNDGRTDIVLVGGADWTQAKVAFSNGNGTFSIRQGAAPNFMYWATSTSAARLVGDFNGDRTFRHCSPRGSKLAYNPRRVFERRRFVSGDERGGRRIRFLGDVVPRHQACRRLQR